MIIASRLCRPAYAADSEALAALEILVHLSSVGQFPEHICVKVGIPESFVLDIRDFAGLPADWNRRYSGETRAIGTRWLLEGSSAVLRVPSMVVPRESNYMLNPAHPRVPEIELSEPLEFEFDVRLLAGTQ